MQGLEVVCYSFSNQECNVEENLCKEAVDRKNPMLSAHNLA
jgi:hypothetical protein